MLGLVAGRSQKIFFSAGNSHDRRGQRQKGEISRFLFYNGL
jgi:hypothetical protein